MQQFNFYAKQVCPHHYLSGQYAAGITNRELISAQDLSAALWIFSALGFVINNKTTNKLSIEMRAFGFTMSTKTMTVALPIVKMDAIQSYRYPKSFSTEQFV